MAIFCGHDARSIPGSGIRKACPGALGGLSIWEIRHPVKGLTDSGWHRGGSSSGANRRIRVAYIFAPKLGTTNQLQSGHLNWNPKPAGLERQIDDKQDIYLQLAEV
jgi:hypothetical protein